MPKLIIICGISFAGKSLLGATIAGRFGYAQVDVDDIKFSLFGRNIRDEALSQTNWERLYDQTYRLIREYLRAGTSVVDGSGNFKRSERQTVRGLVDSLEDETITIWVDTPAAIARQRLLTNRDRRTRLEVTDEDFEDILRVWEPPSPDEQVLVFRYGDDMDAWIARHASLLRACLALGKRARLIGESTRR
jgi:predicted kinase